ncbi:hypothetical protein [uncultured Ruminococcus sp.]|uniref:hypothetical protein n=1 Tax=uncultured Ruminococcus sp. TaxID=165186 RepID=UPI0026DC7EE5|nr:hypothetical protein [uncultured Ruminococcus sp.]
MPGDSTPAYFFLARNKIVLENPHIFLVKTGFQISSAYRIPLPADAFFPSGWREKQNFQTMRLSTSKGNRRARRIFCRNQMRHGANDLTEDGVKYQNINTFGVQAASVN